MNSDQIITSIEPELHPQFFALLTKYVKIIADNKEAFVAYDSKHKDQTAQDIFSNYWLLSASSSTIAPETTQLTRKDAGMFLPVELTKLID